MYLANHARWMRGTGSETDLGDASTYRRGMAKRRVKDAVFACGNRRTTSRVKLTMPHLVWYIRS